VELLLSRAPKPYPTMNINNAANSIFDFKFEDFDLINYDPWPAIKAPVAV
jgi:thymidylate synthase